jgi:hypothetical protein
MKQICVSSNCLMRALPNGTVPHIQPAILDDFTADAISDLRNVPLHAEVKRLLSLGSVLLQSGNASRARDAYRRAILAILDAEDRAAYDLRLMRNRDLLYAAARGYDRASAIVDPNHERHITYRRAVAHYLAIFDDWNYCFRGIDYDIHIPAHLHRSVI